MIDAIAFDFDGVLAESVDIKTRAFAKLFAAETPEAVRAIVEYHKANGGLSRHVKIRWMYEHVLKRPLSDTELNALADRFSTFVMDDVVASPWVPGAREFVEYARQRWPLFVVSGTPAGELRQILERRRMSSWFRDVYGAPTPKADALRTILGTLDVPPDRLLFVGDAANDWRAAVDAGVRFAWRPLPGVTSMDGYAGPVVHDLRELEALAA